MAVSVAEYLGVRTDSPTPIKPVQLGKNNTPKCPFMNWHCTKAYSKNHPVCSVRASDGELWITCSHRLCSTNAKAAGLNKHQKSILTSVSTIIYDEISAEEVLYKQEAPIKVSEQSTYHADYIMWRLNATQSPYNPDRAIVLEIQGGGETSNTGEITRHLDGWVESPTRTNAQLATVVQANPLVTNAWRRQQEQFLVKGNVAMQTGGRMVFCVGTLLYKYLMPRITNSVTLTDLKNANWTLALIAFQEEIGCTNNKVDTPDAIPLKVAENSLLFTNYSSFVQALTNQGKPSPSLFSGNYLDFAGNIHIIH